MDDLLGTKMDDLLAPKMDNIEQLENDDINICIDIARKKKEEFEKNQLENNNINCIIYDKTRLPRILKIAKELTISTDIALCDPKTKEEDKEEINNLGKKLLQELTLLNRELTKN